LFNSGLTIVASVVKRLTTHQFTVIFEILNSVVLKIQVVWDVMLCSWKSLGLLVNMKTLWSFRVLGTTHPAAQHHILEDLDHLHIFCCAHMHDTLQSQWHYMPSAVNIQWQWHYMPTAINVMATSHQYLIQCA